MGRWPSGAPVALAGTANDPALAADPAAVNRFDYETDQLGLACPRGAHVQRVRPRNGNPANRGRLLLRRGLPYGDALPEGAPDEGERGLVGFFLNASIERQFEFVQRKWINWGQWSSAALGPGRTRGAEQRQPPARPAGPAGGALPCATGRRVGRTTGVELEMELAYAGLATGRRGDQRVAALQFAARADDALAPILRKPISASVIPVLSASPSGDARAQPQLVRGHVDGATAAVAAARG